MSSFLLIMASAGLVLAQGADSATAAPPQNAPAQGQPARTEAPVAEKAPADPPAEQEAAAEETPTAETGEEAEAAAEVSEELRRPTEKEIKDTKRVGAFWFISIGN